MIQFLRGHASSWLIKIILGLIVVSFGVWGISGLFIGRGQQVLVAKVGDVEISKQYFVHLLQSRLRLANMQMKDTNLTLEQAIKLGVHEKLLDELVRQTLIEQEIRSMKLTASRSMISDMIMGDPTFKNERGRFDEALFKRLLANSGRTEAGYVNERIQKLAEAQLMSAVSAASKPAGSLSLTLFNNLFEKRTVELYTVNEEELRRKHPEIEKTTNGDLKKYYEANLETFRTPEKRAFSVLLLDPETLAKGYSFSNKEIKAGYEEFIDNYAVPEKRDLQIFVDTDWRKVKLMSKALEQGKNIPLKTLTILKGVTQAELNDKLGEEAFDLKVGEVSDVVKSNEGFQTVKVLKITPPTTKSLKQVRTQVIADLQRQKAMDEMATLIQTIEDAISGGASLEEVAKDHKLKLIKETKPLALASKKQNHHKDLDDQMIKTAFEQEADEVGPVVELEDGRAYVVNVSDIQPENVKSFDALNSGERGNVRDHVLQSRLEETVKKEARFIFDAKKIEGILAKQGITFNGKVLSKKHSIPPAHLMLLKRDHAARKRVLPPMNFTGLESNPEIDQKLRAEIWKVEKHGAAEINYQGSPAVIYVKDIKPAVVEKNIGEYTSLKHEMMEMLNRDLVLQYLDALKQKYGVTIYEDVLSTLGE